MREAMYRAEVGDDVYGEDPSINRLQELAAERLGKEAALFVASGTMGNASAIMAHAARGESMIGGDQSAIYRYEVGGASTLGCSPMIVIPNEPDGMLNPHLITIHMSDGSDQHSAPTVLLCIENTHNRCGGTVLNREQVETLTSLAHSHNMHVHLDGARIFNAAIALNMPVSELVRSVDSVMFCLSKGLSAPVGSMLAGSRAFIKRARRMRKMLGGGMRQAGVLAAAGICALTENVEPLAEDHANALELARGLQGLPAIAVDLGRVETNMVYAHCLPPLTRERFVALCLERGIKVDASSPGTVRMVTHRNVSRQEI